eukprot:687457-Pyramimonas_sp.AAC.1
MFPGGRLGPDRAEVWALGAAVGSFQEDRVALRSADAIAGGGGGRDHEAEHQLRGRLKRGQQTLMGLESPGVSGAALWQARAAAALLVGAPPRPRCDSTCDATASLLCWCHCFVLGDRVSLSASRHSRGVWCGDATEGLRGPPSEARSVLHGFLNRIGWSSVSPMPCRRDRGDVTSAGDACWYERLPGGRCQALECAEVGAPSTSSGACA